MRILIVEDETLAAERLIQLIKQCIPEVEIFGPLDSVAETVDHLKKQPAYDLIFMDIQLADGKCFSVFEKSAINTPVIFTTAYDEYALQAFEHNSIDYLLKPVKAGKLKDAIEKYMNIRDYYSSGRAARQLNDLLKNLKLPSSKPCKDRFLISKGDAMFSVRAEEIACFYAEEKGVFLLTHTNNKYLIPYAVEELAEMLDPARFFRVNRQYIVAADAIRKVYIHFNFKLKVELKVDPKAEILISRSRTTRFKAWMNGEAPND